MEFDYILLAFFLFHLLVRDKSSLKCHLRNNKISSQKTLIKNQIRKNGKLRRSLDFGLEFYRLNIESALPVLLSPGAYRLCGLVYDIKD